MPNKDYFDSKSQKVIQTPLPLAWGFAARPPFRLND